ncbi:MAG: hypothetical protein ACXAC2_24235 [Candidatus Kariarchaeaceae archaeon]
MSREYKDVNPAKLIFPSVGLSLLGVVFAYVNRIEIGLTLIFFGGLFIFGTLIYKRLYVLGAEKWAIGSIIVWLGFFLSSLPVFGYAWGLMTNSTRLILFSTGLLFVFLGFLTEFFDLNLKLLNLIKQTKIKVAEFVKRLKSRLLSSVWIFLMFISSIWLITSLLIPQVLEPLNRIVPESTYLDSRFFLLYVFVLSLILETRELIILFLSSFTNAIYLLLQGLGRRILQAKGLITGAYYSIIALIRKIGIEINRFITLVLTNNYSLGFFFFIVFGILSYFRSDQILFAISTLMLFSGLTTFLIQKPEFIADTVSNIHHSTYRQSLRVRNRFTKTQSFACANCNAHINSTYPNCVDCGHRLPVCSVCKNKIIPGSKIMQCNHCSESGHSDHLDRWLLIKTVCPNCRLTWEIQESTI